MVGVAYHAGSNDGWVGGYGDGFKVSSNRNQDMSYGSSEAFVHAGGSYNLKLTSSEYVGKPTYYTSRPTNTSVLYCIKY